MLTFKFSWSFFFVVFHSAHYANIYVYLAALQWNGTLTAMKLWHTSGATSLLAATAEARPDDQQDESFQEPDFYDEISAKLKSYERV